ncbi:hypothetical protein LEP1GSC021_0530 [Leptospira noguchii str. 1993005606]|uniref:HEAT repeat domain-containing protein n=2 Tax=Leptospira noguchii TaxID=28182 RepID=M6Y1T1_9LEPT|nr:hypothetical protein [Leptospira noguchii]EMM99487.1 hypothetical protein LEP1GSC035_1120 [Leptospira noguchii str. 2007001578]EMO87645.1 hypothetical protein LEP1GSC024_3529 [Leptospira noguchii str. 2001034031]EPE82271.1 hypothetical protein LEP1GSC021_0530 [Leptospira noguchii str. 1993005606]
MINLKINFFGVAVVFLFGIFSVIQAQTLDQNQYQKIKAIVTQTGHIEKETLIREIYTINSNPQEYLIAIARDPDLRVYALSQINELIADFGGNSAMNYLESTIASENTHPSIRSSAAFSYGKTFYFLDKIRTENFLNRYSANDQIGVSIRNTLRGLRSGKINSIRFSERLKKENLNRIQNKNLKKPDSSN